MTVALIKWRRYGADMETTIFLFLIAVAFAVLAGLGVIDGSDSRDWIDTRPWWPDEAPRTA